MDYRALEEEEQARHAISSSSSMLMILRVQLVLPLLKRGLEEEEQAGHAISSSSSSYDDDIACPACSSSSKARQSIELMSIQKKSSEYRRETINY